MGYSVTTLAKNSRQSGPKASPKCPRGMENALELSQLFAARYPYNGKSQSTDLDAVEKHVKEQFSDPENFSIEGALVIDKVAAQVCQEHVMHNTRLTLKRTDHRKVQNHHQTYHPDLPRRPSQLAPLRRHAPNLRLLPSSPFLLDAPPHRRRSLLFLATPTVRPRLHRA